MGLRQVFADAAETIFNAFDDVPVSVTYKGSPTIDMYNPSTGERIAVQQSVVLDLIQMNFKRHEIDGVQVRTSDIKAIIKQADLSLTPAVEDTVTIGSDTWRVKYFKGDSADATWELHLRKG